MNAPDGRGYVRRITWDPYEEPDERAMRFRLTYEGRLLTSQESRPQPEHKHAIRRQFHTQLKQFWGFHPGLQYLKKPNPHHTREKPMIDDIVSSFSNHGFNWAPLGRSDLGLMCKVEVLLLRRPAGDGGGIYSIGDLDNRVKTLIDALAIPPQKNAYPTTGPTPEEDPFFVLLDNDKVITHLSVETDYLFGEVVKLDPHGKPEPPDQADVRATITVSIQPTSTFAMSMMYHNVFA